jgi:hypothetical protein|tara:strand:+ start:1979 stop:2227 length:249 start_codon:yes stop_codon:yes gene_type:complete
MLRNIFFGYLSIKYKIITRIISCILIILSPVFYYKTIDGIFIEDIIAMYIYNGGLELFWFWFFSFIVICLISLLFSLTNPTK